MGILATLRNALGLQPPLTPKELEPLSLTARAEARLDALPDGHGLHVRTAPGAIGRVVRLEEAPAEEPLHFPDPADRDRLAGLALDWDGRWSLRLALRIDARDTPNPDSRLYLADRWLARGPALFYTRESAPLPDLARHLFAVDGVRSVLFRDNTLTVEREPGAPWPDVERGVDAALRAHFLTLGVALTADDRVRRDDPLEEAVQQVLDEQILPGIHRDGGDLELIDVSGGVVRVRLVGACRSCPAATATLRMGVERLLKQALPGEVERVEQV